MGKRVACCVCGLRQAWGKAGWTGDIISRKNNKIRNHPPSHSSSSLLSPFISQLSMNSSLYLTLFSSPISCTPLLFCSAASPSLFSLTNQFSSERTPRSFLHHRSYCLPIFCLALSWTDGLQVTQHISPRSVKILEGFCSCWGPIQHSPSQGKSCDPPLCGRGNGKFSPGAGTIQYFPFQQAMTTPWGFVCKR